MAGDWIKMRVNLTDDPAVIAIAEKLGTDEFAVVGRLHKLWAWADAHTSTGIIPRVSVESIDRKVSLPGFAEAMCEVGWLSVVDGGIEFPGFEKHNGKSAKRRAENTTRVSKKRCAQGVTTECAQNADNEVTECAPEKRREEKKESTNVDSDTTKPAKSRKAKATSVPDAKVLPDDLSRISGFSNLWSAWCDHRESESLPITANVKEIQVNRLRKWIREFGESAMVEFVEMAVSGRWQDLRVPFEYQKSRSPPSGKPSARQINSPSRAKGRDEPYPQTSSPGCRSASELDSLGDEGLDWYSHQEK